jgi:alcohol dehydrogenase class IV
MVESAFLQLPRRVVFGTGALAALATEARALGASALVCTDPNIAATDGFARALALLADAGIETRVFADTPPDIPPAAVAACLDVARGFAPEVVIGVGGGSSLDMAKVVALLLRHPGPLETYYGENGVPGPIVPVVAVPTTAGTGSEVTPVAVVSDPGRRLKVGVSDPQLVPSVAICDPELTLTCPPGVTAHAGIDALMHAVESYLAPPRETDWAAASHDVFRGRSALTAPYSLAAIREISGALERAVSDGSDREARARMLSGSLRAGIAFGHAGTGGAHALQYAVGAATGTPHGLGVGLLAPYVLAYVAPAAERELADIAAAMGVPDAIAEVARLLDAIGVPRTLRQLGVAQVDLPQLADDAATVQRLLRNSPRPLDRDALLDILGHAWSGEIDLGRAV